MINRIHNEKNITQCLPEGRGETCCHRRQQANRFRYRLSIKEHQIKHIQRENISS